MAKDETSQHPAPPSQAQRSIPRKGPQPLAECFLCRAGAVLLCHSLCPGPSVLSEVRPPTGEPDAGDPHVRFGGRGGRELNRLSLPLSGNAKRTASAARSHARSTAAPRPTDEPPQCA